MISEFSCSEGLGKTEGGGGGFLHSPQCNSLSWFPSATDGPGTMRMETALLKTKKGREKEKLAWEEERLHVEPLNFG